jgi:hypothetical protein
MPDKPLYICKTCRFSSPPFIQGDIEKIECRRNHPDDGFPILDSTAWCWDGMLCRDEENRLLKLLEA